MSDEGDELSDEAADLLEIEDGVAARVVEAGGEVRPIGCGAGDTILEYTFAIGGLARVELAVEHLTT